MNDVWMQSRRGSRGATARPRRRGFSTMEVMASLSLLMTVMAATIPIFTRHGRLLSESRRERIAIEELANQAERLTAVDPAELDDYLTDIVPSPLARERLPAAELVVTRGDSPLGERVILSLSWDAAGRREHPLTLAVWLTPPTGVRP